MWFEGSRLDSVRHDCRREDDIKRWGWKEFDRGSFGTQTLTDVHNYVKLDMDYIQDGDKWTARIRGKETKAGPKKHNVTLIFYYGVSGPQSSISYPSISKSQRQAVTL